MSRLPVLVPLAVTALAVGCAALDAFTVKANRLRAETAALVHAARETDKDCQAMQEPKPAVCTTARRILDAIEPYVGKAP